MSGVSSVYGDYGIISSLADLLNGFGNSDSPDSASSPLASSPAGAHAALQSRKARNAYGGSGATAIGQAAIRRALGEMESDGTGKVTFRDIAAHREKLETVFTLQVRVELAKLGVSTDTDFTLTMTPDGKIQVDCDDAAIKEKIERYLEDHADVCEQFGYIQALANLERARQSPAGNLAAWREVRDAQKAYQFQAVEAFFSEALRSGMNYSSLVADFSVSASSEDSAGFYAGLDFTV
jgi:hypothetical protein